MKNNRIKMGKRKYWYKVTFLNDGEKYESEWLDWNYNDKDPKCTDVEKTIKELGIITIKFKNDIGGGE